MTTATMEGNRIIAEFMGAKLTNRPDPFWPDDISKNRWYAIFKPGNNPNQLVKAGTEKQLYDLRYHESWDWLMPVYRKIRDVLNDKKRPSINHVCKGDALEVDIHCAVTTIDIMKAHEAIVIFINWYNTSNRPDGE